MKRYRVLSFDMDFRASHLSLEINNRWEPDVKEMHRQNKERLIEGLLNDFGSINGEAKIRNFLDLGDSPLSIIAFHNKFFRQIRHSFVIGSNYPALTGACALGERILNHLLLNLRGFYKTAPEYKKIHRKSSFDNWQIAIDILAAWNILLPEVVVNFRKLAEIRNQTIHFNPETDRNDHELALKAIQTLSNIILDQFCAFGLRPWFITDTPGASFIKKEVEEHPFIKTIYLPNCTLVGPYHELTLEMVPGGPNVTIRDEYEYEEKEISDGEFAELFRNKR
jgi:hypothetical protein